jgi:hypothetical protein
MNYAPTGEEVMKSSPSWIAVPLVVLLAACGGDTVDDSLDTGDLPEPAAEVTPPPAPMEQPGMSQTAQFQAAGGSGVTGDVVLTDRGAQTELVVNLANAPANASLPGHIHSGTCEAPGAVVQPLEPVAVDANGRGSSTSSVNVPSATVMNGEHIVAYHGEGGAPIACAAIPAHVM